MTEAEIREVVAGYWFDHYQDDCCTLCGNHGIIDTRGVKTQRGAEIGRLNYCICPNGQILREQGVEIKPG